MTAILLYPILTAGRRVLRFPSMIAWDDAERENAPGEFPDDWNPQYDPRHRAVTPS